MRVTIFGATGMLGKALVRRWEDDIRGEDEVTGLGSAQADIRDPAQVATPTWMAANSIRLSLWE